MSLRKILVHGWTWLVNYFGESKWERAAYNKALVNTLLPGSGPCQKHFIQNKGPGWLVWIKNTSLASLMGGEWKRKIWSASSILSSLLKTNRTSLNDEALCTLMSEAILNSQSFTVEVLSDGNSANPINLSNLLSRKSLPDIYCCK